MYTNIKLHDFIVCAYYFPFYIVTQRNKALESKCAQMQYRLTELNLQVRRQEKESEKQKATSEQM